MLAKYMIYYIKYNIVQRKILTTSSIVPLLLSDKH